MNSEMKATALVVATARELASNAGRLTRDTYWDRNFSYEEHFVIPAKYLDALLVAIEDRDELIKLNMQLQRASDEQDHNDTILSFASDVESAIRRGAKRG